MMRVKKKAHLFLGKRFECRDVKFVGPNKLPVNLHRLGVDFTGSQDPKPS